MKRARFSEEQIITVLKEAESGAKVTELCRRHGISDATFYTWRSKYGGLEVSEMRRLRQLEEENRRLKSIVADQAATMNARSTRTRLPILRSNNSFFLIVAYAFVRIKPRLKGLERNQRETPAAPGIFADHLMVSREQKNR